MQIRTKLWLGVGSFVLVGGTSLPIEHASDLFSIPQAWGEGGARPPPEVGAPLPTLYTPHSDVPDAPSLDAGPEIEGYVDLVHESYVEAAAKVGELHFAVTAFLANPSEAGLAAARAAWVAARPSYLVTETFRFYDGPIEEVEGRINAWPVNEAVIDYVEGDSDAGLINDPAKPLSLDQINAVDQKADEADVTTGWHAIEFLLWGQDLSADGPGARPYTDYLPELGHNERRRAYLDLVTMQLEADLGSMAAAWDPADPYNYAAKFKAAPQREALGRMLNGMAILAGFEFMSERLTVALDSGDQEDEHSCFSDTTKQDFVYDLVGIERVWTGKAPSGQRPGLDRLVGRFDPALKARVDDLFADAKAKVGTLGDPWDRVLAQPDGTPERVAAEAAVVSLQALAAGLKAVGDALGVVVQIPAS